MKKSSFFLSLAFIALCFTTSFANPIFKANTDLQEKVKKVLNNFDFDDMEGQTLKIRFMLNDKDEIIVVSTNDKNLDDRIKTALNYTKIDRENLRHFEVYVLPVRFSKS